MDFDILPSHKKKNKPQTEKCISFKAVQLLIMPVNHMATFEVLLLSYCSIIKNLLQAI